jgi:hypothetical protein
MRAFWIAGALCTWSLAAVAKEYVAPSGAPLATLEIRNETSTVILPVTFSKPRKCTGVLMLAKGAVWMGKRSLPARESVTVDIDASQEFTLYVEATQGNGVYSDLSSCRLIFTFKPDEGRRYVATATTATDSCQLSIQREVSDAKGARSLEKEPSLRRRELPAISIGAFGSQCREEAPAPR